MEGSGASSPTLAQRSEHSSRPRAAEEHRCMCDQLRTRIPRALMYGMRVPVRHAWGSQARAVPPCPRPSPPRTSPGGASPAPGLTGLGDIYQNARTQSEWCGTSHGRAVPKSVPLRLRACKHRALGPDCSQITEHPSQVSAPLVLGFDLSNATRMKRVWCVHATATRTNRASLSIIMAFLMNLATQLGGCCLWARLSFGAHSWCVCVLAGGIVQAIHFEQTRDGCEPDLAGAPPRPVWKPAQDVAGAQLGGTSHCTSLNQLSG